MELPFAVNSNSSCSSSASHAGGTGGDSSYLQTDSSCSSASVMIVRQETVTTATTITPGLTVNHPRANEDIHQQALLMSTNSSSSLVTASSHEAGGSCSLITSGCQQPSEVVHHTNDERSPVIVSGQPFTVSSGLQVPSSNQPVQLHQQHHSPPVSKQHQQPAIPPSSTQRQNHLMTTPATRKTPYQQNPTSKSPAITTTSTISNATSTVASKVTSMFSNWYGTSGTQQQQQQQHSNAVAAPNPKLKGQRITSPSTSNSSSEASDGGVVNVNDSESEDNMTEIIDFAYVNVTDEDEVDIWLDNTASTRIGADSMYHTSLFSNHGVEEFQQPKHNVDILTVLLGGSINQQQQQNATESESSTMVHYAEQGNVAAKEASYAKLHGNLQAAFQKHSESAKYFHDAAVLFRQHNSASMANSLILLSQTQAKSALALKRALKVQPKALLVASSISSQKNATGATGFKSSLEAVVLVSHKDRIRATVRGALDTHHQTEADISESTFLGRATSDPQPAGSQKLNISNNRNGNAPFNQLSSANASNSTSGAAITASGEKNPVDEMMELERELKDMDMALEMGNSIASLSNLANTSGGHGAAAFLKNSISDGSFMVVPPGSQSYMSSSVIWGTAGASPGPTASGRPHANTNVNSHTGPRARANRLHSVGARQPHHQQQHQQLILPPHAANATTKSYANVPPQSHLVQQQQHITTNTGGLESSWWGNNSVYASQILSSSVISLATGNEGSATQPTQVSTSNNTKQLLRLMDSLKTLGDENAALLREVEEAEAARMEAKAAKEQMRRFKEEYGKRFAALKEALEKFRKGYPCNTAALGGDNNTKTVVNPVTGSEYLRSASVSEQLQRQEQLIRKLTADLKREKEESKKKDVALRKYESFYKEVKARSAQKAAQRNNNVIETTTASPTKQQVTKQPAASGHPPRAGGHPRMPRS